jgi:hypothetical protein
LLMRMAAVQRLPVHTKEMLGSIVARPSGAKSSRAGTPRQDLRPREYPGSLLITEHGKDDRGYVILTQMGLALNPVAENLITNFGPSVRMLTIA